MQLKKLLSIVLIVVFIFSFSSYAEENENLIRNGSFQTSTGETPEGWLPSAYLSSDTDVLITLQTDEEIGSCVKIDNLTGNDTRLIQAVSVEPDTVYYLSCLVKTENIHGTLGATLSIDNYSIDETYCYSEPAYGTTNWHELSMYVLTGKNQNTLNVAARLGGYSMNATGTAWFTDIYMTEGHPVEDDIIIDITNETGLSNYILESPMETDTFTYSETTPLIGCLICFVLLLIISGFLYFRYLRGLSLTENETSKSRGMICIMLLLAFTVRVVLSLIFRGHSTDINCFMAWGNAMLNGPASFYTSGMFADYPPGYMYILGACAYTAKLFGIPYGSGLYVLLYKLPAIFADLITAVLIYRAAIKNHFSETAAFILLALAALNPVASFISGAWGQIDSLLTLGLLISVLLFMNGKPIPCGAVYGFTILLKPQALILGPAFAALYIADIFCSKERGKKLLFTLASVLAAFAVIFVFSYPFQSTQEWNWLIDKYLSTAGSYAYASIEAFNFPALLGGNWKSVDSVVFGLTYKTWGTVFILLSVVLSVVLYVKSFKKRRGAAFLSSAFMMTMIFTFGHYMHERYLFPVLILLIFSYIYEKDRRILISYLWLGASLLLNVLAAMYIVDHQAARGQLYSALTAIGSLSETIGFFQLAYLTFDILWFDKTLPEIKPSVSRLRYSAEHSVSTENLIPKDRTDTKLHYTKKDRIYVISLTIVYAAVALINLGTVHAPETVWEADTECEPVTVSFGYNAHVSSYGVYCNIGDPSISQSGVLKLSWDDGETLYTETYDQMFRWDITDVDFMADSVELSVYSGRLKINEIAFYDENGSVIPVTIQSGGESANLLIDEQDTVPLNASYYNGMYFDELYHARTAYEHLHNLKPYENSHPPLGKLIMMLGVAIFGMTPFGWRISGTLIGIFMLPVLYAFSKRLFHKSDYAFVTAGLFAFDFMHFTQTRIATIDVYAVFFILLMYDYMYQYISMNFYSDGLKATLKPLAIAGVFFGLGAASKWICFYAGGGLAILFFASLIRRGIEYSKIMKHGTSAQKKQVSVFPKYVVRTILWCILFYIIVPGMIYFASYTPYFIYDAADKASYGFSDMIRVFWDYQAFMFNYHSGLTATHPYQSSWWQWPFTLRPMWYYYGGVINGTVSTLTASGNPAVWWICSAGALAVLFARLTNRLKKDLRLQLFFVGVAANFIPWVFVTRCTFIYHFFATVPFILLASVYGLMKLEEKYESLKLIKWVWLGIAVAFFIFLYPGISGLRVSTEWAAFIKLLPGGGLMYGA